VYNRIIVDGQAVYQPAGYTEGFGHFQFSEALFRDLIASTRINGPLRGNKYGQGPNWKMRTIRTTLEQIGLPGDLLRHGVRRQVYLAPVATNWVEYLRGETDVIELCHRPLEHLSAYFRSRWAIPRATRRPCYKDWDRDNMRLTPLLPHAPSPLRLF
jgi:hypothetical protein